MEFNPILSREHIRTMTEAGFWSDRLLTDYLDEAVRKSPDRVAIVDRNSMTGQRTRLTYAELDERVERIAHGLTALGIGPRDVVSFQLPNWWEFTALHLACLRIGAVTNPLMPIFRERELSFMLGLTESKIFIVPRSFRGFDHAALGRRLKSEIPTLRHVLVVGGEGDEAFESLLARKPAASGAAPAFANSRTGANDVIQILFTSGTTGEPKAVMHTSNTLVFDVLAYIRQLGLTPDDIALMSSPLAHLTGFLVGLMVPIVLGTKTVLQDIWQPEEAATLIAEEGATFTMATTPFLLDLTETAERRPDTVASLRKFVVGGAPIPRVLARRAATVLGATITPVWGMTEIGVATGTKLEDGPEKIFETDGCALPHFEIRVVDAEGREVPPDEEGRLLSRSPSTFVGYLKRPEWYCCDAEGWLDSGDLARMSADGYIRITGRSKDIIIRGGENIPVAEIENLIYRHSAVLEVAVVGMPDERLGERGCAFVTLRENTNITLPELVTFLSEARMAKQYHPERLEILPELPKTPSGKIQKFRLREMAKALGAG